MLAGGCCSRLWGKTKKVKNCSIDSHIFLNHCEKWHDLNKFLAFVHPIKLLHFSEQIYFESMWNNFNLHRVQLPLLHWLQLSDEILLQPLILTGMNTYGITIFSWVDWNTLNQCFNVFRHFPCLLEFTVFAPISWLVN